jgi:hypothetical protein
MGQAGRFQDKPGLAHASQVRRLERPMPAAFEQVETAGGWVNHGLKTLQFDYR